MLFTEFYSQQECGCICPKGAFIKLTHLGLFPPQGFRTWSPTTLGPHEFHLTAMALRDTVSLGHPLQPSHPADLTRPKQSSRVRPSNWMRSHIPPSPRCSPSDLGVVSCFVPLQHCSPTRQLTFIKLIPELPAAFSSELPPDTVTTLTTLFFGTQRKFRRLAAAYSWSSSRTFSSPHVHVSSTPSDIFDRHEVPRSLCPRQCLRSSFRS